MREVVTLPQLLAQVRVLLDQPLTLGVGQPLDLERLGDHRGDDPEKPDRVVVVAVALERADHGKRAGRLAIEHDRHADERDLLLVRLAALPRNSGSRLTCGTTTGLQLSTTRPVTPLANAVPSPLALGAGGRAQASTCSSFGVVASAA